MRNEVVRVLKEEGKDDLLEQMQRDFDDEGKPPLLSVEEALVREGGEEARQRALHREEEDVEGMAGAPDAPRESDAVDAPGASGDPGSESKR